MASSSMQEMTGFENQNRESIPTLRWPIKLVNMVNSLKLRFMSNIPNPKGPQDQTNNALVYQETLISL